MPSRPRPSASSPRRLFRGGMFPSLLSNLSSSGLFNVVVQNILDSCQVHATCSMHQRTSCWVAHVNFEIMSVRSPAQTQVSLQVCASKWALQPRHERSVGQSVERTSAHAAERIGHPAAAPNKATPGTPPHPGNQSTLKGLVAGASVCVQNFVLFAHLSFPS